jgi:dipeptidyl aminopeptidase/acylaminoacyl peptidase
MNGDVSLAVGGDRSIANVTRSADGSRLAFIAGSFTNPCDVFTCDADGSDVRQLTNVNADLLAELAIQTPEHMPFESFDGAYTLDAWIIRPVGVEAGTKAPLVQIIHGGPHSIFGHTFFFDMQLWASQGWNVLFMNPRASQGYGEAFATGAIADWGGVDWKEQEQALDLAIERGGVDPDRLAVTGLSYGGFMTNWIVGQTDRYKVAASENGICNLVSFYGTADIGWYFLEHEMEKPIWENLDWYMRASPIWYVDRMKTPMLLLQAEADYRCPIEQGEQLFTALLARGIPTEMVRFPGENHVQLSNGKPETRLVRRQVTLEWFKKYL